MSRSSLSIDDLPPHAQAKVREQVNGVQLGKNSPLRATRAKPRELEMIEQRKVINWADAPEQRAKWPELARLFHVPNGGHRSKAVAGKMKSIGVRPGVPDLWLPAARQFAPSALQAGRFVGIVIELKAGAGGQASGLQRGWLDYLRKDGWMVKVCLGADDAIWSLTNYLTQPRPDA